MRRNSAAAATTCWVEAVVCWLAALTCSLAAARTHRPEWGCSIDATQRFAAAADHDAVRERHYRHYLALAERHGDERALWGADRNEHLARLDAEIDNLLQSSERAVGPPAGGCRLR